MLENKPVYRREFCFVIGWWLIKIVDITKSDWTG